jgi:hypothetical protein
MVEGAATRMNRTAHTSKRCSFCTAFRSPSAERQRRSAAEDILSLRRTAS